MADDGLRVSQPGEPMDLETGLLRERDAARDQLREAREELTLTLERAKSLEEDMLLAIAERDAARDQIGLMAFVHRIAQAGLGELLARRARRAEDEIRELRAELVAAIRARDRSRIFRDDALHEMDEARSALEQAQNEIRELRAELVSATRDRDEARETLASAEVALSRAGSPTTTPCRDLELDCALTSVGRLRELLKIEREHATEMECQVARLKDELQKSRAETSDALRRRPAAWLNL